MTSAGATSARRPRVRHWLLLSGVLLLVAATMVPPLVNINRYQRRIADSISRAVGRPVHMSTVKLRLLPRPGFEIEDLVISEDPAFGAEPMLHSSSVVAYIRLISLWRGRLEIARISFDEPSLNLVRNASGQWNVGSVLAQASRIQNAPTSQRHASGALRFPYIEANNARVNIKLGEVKQPFSFLNADLSMWLDQPDQWQLRFEAQPVRTDLDLNLSDTGVFQLEGSLRRTSWSLGEMPVNLRAEWSNAPLGELSLLLMGKDSGWRGALDVRADITGTSNDAQIKARLRGVGVHRVEFEPPQRLDVETTCEANYRRSMRALQELTCFTPTGEGHLLLTGEVGELPEHPRPVLRLRVQHLPVAWVFAGVRVVRNGFAPTAVASGTVDGEFTYETAGNAPGLTIQGKATVEGMEVGIPGIAKPVVLPTFAIGMQEPAPATVARHGKARPASALPPPVPQVAALIVVPVAVNLGGTAPLTIDGRLTAKEFSLRIAGGSSIDRLIPLSQAFGIFAGTLGGLGAQGTADVQLGVQGPWLLPVLDPDRPTPTAGVAGTVRLHNATLATGFLASPLSVVSAQGRLGDGEVTWSPVTVTYGKLRADGSFVQPLACEDAAGCTPSFDMHVDSMSAAELQSTLLGGTHGQVLEEILERLKGTSHAWPPLEGMFRANTFSLETLELEDVTAKLKVKGNKLTLDAVDGGMLGGALHLSGSMDASGSLPVYTLEAQITHADPARVAALFDERWGSGTINVSTQLTLAGFTAEQLTSSAEGKFHWDWLRGSLPVAADALPALTPLARFDRWNADGAVRESELSITHSLLTRAGEEMPLAGSLSFGRELAIHSEDAERPLAIEGTLEHPRLPVAAKAPGSKPVVYHPR